MKIIVVGANEYGINVISSLLRLRHEVVLIEKSTEYASFLVENSGLTVINGDARLLATLKEADIKTADCVISLTADDSSNIVISKIANCYFGVPSTIATISELDYTEPENFNIFSKNNFAITNTIDVDGVLSESISRTLLFQGAKDIAYAENVIVIRTVCKVKSTLVNTPISHVSSLLDFQINILAIIRNNVLLNISQSDIILNGDEVFFSVEENNLSRALYAFGHNQYVYKSIVFVLENSCEHKITNTFLNKLYEQQDYYYESNISVSFIKKDDVVFDDWNKFVSIFGNVDAVCIYTDDICFNTTLACTVSSINKGIRVVSISKHNNIAMIDNVFNEYNYIHVNTSDIIKQSVLSNLNGVFKIICEWYDGAGYIIEVKVSEEHQWIGATVKNFAYKFDIMPIAIKRSDNIQKIAEDNDILLIGDVVSIFVSQKGLKRLLKML